MLTKIYFNMELIKQLNWRYATKKYTEQTVAEEKIDLVLQAINLSASSCGLQPYRVFAITNLEIRKQLAEGSFNSQIVHSSHLLVFAAFNDVKTSYIEEYIAMAEQQRGLPEGTLVDFKNGLISHFDTQNAEQNAIWSTKQAYIGLGTALIAAAELQIDATPMEGFDAVQIDKVLGLKEKGLHTAVVLSLGYRDTANDYLANMKKVRLPLDEFSTKIK